MHALVAHQTPSRGIRFLSPQRFC